MIKSIFHRLFSGKSIFLSLPLVWSSLAKLFWDNLSFLVIYLNLLISYVLLSIFCNILFLRSFSPVLYLINFCNFSWFSHTYLMFLYLYHYSITVIYIQYLLPFQPLTHFTSPTKLQPLMSWPSCHLHYIFSPPFYFLMKFFLEYSYFFRMIFLVHRQS